MDGALGDAAVLLQPRNIGGKAFQGWRFEQHAQVQLQAQCFTQARDHLGGGDGVAAEQEEMVIGRDRRDVQLLAPDRGDLVLQFAAQRCIADLHVQIRELRIAVEAAIDIPQRTRCTLHLAAGGLRQGTRVEQHHHARRLLIRLGDGLADRLDQRIGRQDFLHAAADFGGNADTFQALVIHCECRDPAFAHHFHFALDGLLDVLRVQVMTAHDQQVFQAAGDVHLTVADKTQVAGAQPGTASVSHKGLGGGFGVAPVAVGDARPGGPELADVILGQFGEGVRVGDQHRVFGLAGAATHDRTALPRLGTVGSQCLLVDAQRRDAMAANATSDKQGRFSQAVGREEIIRGKTAGRELLGEAFQGVEADRFGAGIGHAPLAQVQALQRRLADPFAAQAIGEIRAAADGTAVFADRFQPAQWPTEEVRRRHQHAGHAAEDWLQQAADQAHVVVQRQPADNHVIRVKVDAKAATDQHFVGHQVAMADLHALGQCGGAGGVLQECDVVGVQVGGDPSAGTLQSIDAQYHWGVFDLRQAIGKARDGQQQARLGIADDRQQAFLVVSTGRLRRVSRHRNDPGVQATKERRDVIRAAGEQQHRTVAQVRIGLQGSGDAAGAQVQVAVTEHNAVLGRLSEEAQSDLVRRLHGATLKGLDQRLGKFEGVHHGVPA
ncbi:hypothetical protein [Pseudomonas sp. 24 R 17]|nr:hypothetical protein [Pseudomonas sp. 24 R 17]